MCFFRKFKERVKPVVEEDIIALFGFLKDYGFSYSFQKFDNCFGGYWYVETYSFYNKNGCFTISDICQRGEWGYFFAEKYCEKNFDKLCSKSLDIYSVEKEIWKEPLATIIKLSKYTLKVGMPLIKIEHIRLKH